MNKLPERRIGIIKEYLKWEDDILAARVYGSSCFEKNTVEDVDIAVLVPSKNGICSFDLYRRLQKIRRELSSALGEDADLVPHTLDEVSGRGITPLTFPRYHPSLSYGTDVKDIFPVPSLSQGQVKDFSSADLAKWLLFDTRTITRRQVLRPAHDESTRIFISKLAHGPGNYLTYSSLRDKKESYLANPSDIQTSFKVFEEKTGVPMHDALAWITVLKFGIQKQFFSLEDAFPLITWYETLCSSILREDFAPLNNYVNSEMRRPGVLLIVKDGRERALLIQRDQKSTILNPGIWYPPTEAIALESPHETAVRCAREELGLQVEPIFVAKQETLSGSPRFVYAVDLPSNQSIQLGEGQDYGFFALSHPHYHHFPQGTEVVDTIRKTLEDRLDTFQPQRKEEIDVGEDWIGGTI